MRSVSYAALGLAVLLHLVIFCVLVPWRVPQSYQVAVQHIVVVPAVLVPREVHTKSLVPLINAPKKVIRPLPSHSAPYHASVTQSAQLSATHHTKLPEQVLQQLLKRISILVQQHIIYPESAQINGWQGTVWLRFVLLPDGQLQAIQLQQSSGVHALDHAALQALQSIKQVNVGKAGIDHALSLHLPVRFQAG